MAAVQLPVTTTCLYEGPIIVRHTEDGVGLEEAMDMRHPVGASCRHNPHNMHKVAKMICEAIARSPPGNHLVSHHKRLTPKL